ncbi:hypothetical protein GQ55_6G020300 [Panicum hallii var. hallii]|uniref:BED-type domain-containing protein n=1 Tax=Panicum hallii var. hallii TaxID=1504633 RepID=A0A2T7D2W7_9POAL|nr:hypothetical protein GQ55_6G020300 [Panicum hallii var. hallii]
MAEENTQGQGQPRQRARTTMPPGPSSVAWKSFTRFRDDDGNYRAACERCQKVFAAGAKYGTSTLLRHAYRCRGRETALGVVVKQTAWGVVVKQIKLITTLAADTCTGIAVRFTPADQIEEQQKRCAAYSEKALPFAITTFLAYVDAPSASSTKTTFNVAMAAFFLAVPADLVCMTRPPKWGSLLTYLSWFLLVLVLYLLLISFNEGYSYAILPVPIPVVIALLQLNRSSRALNRDTETGHLNADTEDEAVPAVNNTANNQEADQDLDGIFNLSAGIVNFGGLVSLIFDARYMGGPNELIIGFFFFFTMVLGLYLMMATTVRTVALTLHARHLSYLLMFLLVSTLIATLTHKVPDSGSGSHV